MFQLVIFVGILLKGSSSQTSGNGNTTAAYGGEAHYSCWLDDPTGVLQVTWQQSFNEDESTVNLVSYSDRFGQQVNELYQGKVIFTEASLSSTSITIKNVTWGDESCYICSFNAYPGGSQRRQTCLTVQGISEVKTNVKVTPGEDRNPVAVFSCSATGKPAPTIQWDSSPAANDLDQSETSIVMNSDGTFTSSSNITLQVSPDWKEQVHCLLNTGVNGQRKELIPLVPDTGHEEEEQGGGRPPAGQLTFIIPILFILSCIVVVVAAVMMRGRLKWQRRLTMV